MPINKYIVTHEQLKFARWLWDSFGMSYDQEFNPETRETLLRLDAQDDLHLFMSAPHDEEPEVNN